MYQPLARFAPQRMTCIHLTTLNAAANPHITQETTHHGMDRSVTIPMTGTRRGIAHVPSAALLVGVSGASVIMCPSTHGPGPRSGGANSVPGVITVSCSVVEVPSDVVDAQIGAQVLDEALDVPGTAVDPIRKILVLAPTYLVKPPIFFRAPQIFPQFGGASATGPLAAKGAAFARCRLGSGDLVSGEERQERLGFRILLFSRAARDPCTRASCAAGRPEGVAAVAAGAATPMDTAVMAVVAGMRKRL
ncbi:hypothetical protein ACFVTP_04260 [Streptomyces celluloflavus]|uniref:hypothetical protein n=1 Tax=Streptomyces celluloflavus TaxID=58344 RepID=UPI0036DCE3E7